MKPLASLALGGESYSFFVGLGALILNIAVAAVATVIVRMMLPEGRGYCSILIFDDFTTSPQRVMSF